MDLGTDLVSVPVFVEIINMKENNLHTIYGMNYGMACLFMKEVNIDEVLELIKIKEIKKFEYRTAFEVNFEDKNNIVILYFNDNVIIVSDKLLELTYSEEKLEKISILGSETYLFYNFRIVDMYGFAKMQNGKKVRVYFIDEERIISEGMPIEEETEMGLNLPNNFMEYWNDKTKSAISEDDIIELQRRCIKLDNIECEEVKVIVGKIEKFDLC